jgi:hypothetical protein
VLYIDVLKVYVVHMHSARSPSRHYSSFPSLDDTNNVFSIQEEWSIDKHRFRSFCMPDRLWGGWDEPTACLGGEEI